MRKTLAMLATATLLTTAAGSPALAGAHSNNDKNPAVKYRQDVMASMSNHFAALAAIFMGKVNRPQDMPAHADAIADMAALIPELFPEGSEGGAALAAVWEEPERFDEAAQEAGETTAALAEAAASGDRAVLARAFKAAGDSCKGCHERYKEEDE